MWLSHDPVLERVLRGLFFFNVPPIPEWAAGKAGPALNEIIPTDGLGSRELCSQVWYTYWFWGAGYWHGAGAQLRGAGG